MARGLVCVKCRKFLRMKRQGTPIEEGMPENSSAVGSDETGWGPYKLWMADLWKCTGCGFELVTGFGNGPLAEHYEKEYSRVRELYPPICRVDDCGGAKP